MTPDALSTSAWCLFKSDRRPFAISLAAVVEVVQADRLIRLAHCPPQILGLCPVRREIVPVLSLTSPTSSEEEVSPASPLVVLMVRSEQGAWGIRIDRDGTAVSEGRMEVRADVDASGDSAVVIGMVRRGNLAHSVIDPERTWHNLRMVVEVWYRRSCG